MSSFGDPYSVPPDGSKPAKELTPWHRPHPRVFSPECVGIPQRFVQIGDPHTAPIVVQTGEILSRAVYEFAPLQPGIESNISYDDYAKRFMVRLQQRLVAFEIPTERTELHNSKIEQSETVPVSWWDHWKHDVVRNLSTPWYRLVTFFVRKPPRYRTINTVVRNDYQTTKHYSMEGVMQR
jgi:hypothetical protein